MKTLCVIPARHGSTRLHAKPLQLLRGRPLIAWVCDVARRLPRVDQILVATDHEDIAAAVAREGLEAVMTRPECPSGTDRIHEALRGREADIVINLQGDEPTMPAEAITRALDALIANSWADIGTACVPIFERAQFDESSVVKVVRDAANRALYFSRSPIPSMARRIDSAVGVTIPFGFKHLGLYVYRRAILERFVALAPSPLEKMEALEQLRALEAGMTFICVESPADSIGVDIPDDLARAERALERQT